MNNIEENKPCPFCGSTDISQGEIAGWRPHIGNYSQSECNSCGAAGPAAPLLDGEVDYLDQKATSAWNKRTNHDPNH